MALSVTQHLVGGFDKNCTYICTDTETGAAAIVDPTGDMAQVLADVTHRDALTAIWLTHTHFDHYDGVPAIYDRVGTIPIYVHEWGMPALQTVGYQDVHPFADGDTLTLGNTTMEVLHTPGHSPDGCCFYTEDTDSDAPALLSGDTLFVRGCGRTTPPDAPQLYESLQRLKALPEETVVYPGHDYGPSPTSTLAIERAENRFLIAPDYDTFYQERF